MAENLRLRHRIVRCIRRFLEDEHGFLEVGGWVGGAVPMPFEQVGAAQYGGVNRRYGNRTCKDRIAGLQVPAGGRVGLCPCLFQPVKQVMHQGGRPPSCRSTGAGTGATTSYTHNLLAGCLAGGDAYPDSIDAGGSARLLGALSVRRRLALLRLAIGFMYPCPMIPSRLHVL